MSCNPVISSFVCPLSFRRVPSHNLLWDKRCAECGLQTQVNHIDVRLEGNTAYIMVLTNAPEGVITDEYLQSGEKRVFNALTQMRIKSIDLVFRIIPVRVKEYKTIKR